MAKQLAINHGIFIEMTEVKTDRGYLLQGRGFIRVDHVGTMGFELFRNPEKKSCFRMKIYNPAMSRIVKQFEDKFYFMDYNNRKIIQWIAENGVSLIQTQTDK